MHDYLMKDEKIVWEGRPKPFGLLDSPYRVSLIVRWIIWIVVAVGASIGYYVVAQDPAAGLLIFTIGVPLFFSLQPIFDKKAIQENAEYAITNLRVICYINDRRCWSMHLSDAAEFRIHTLGNGTGVVMMGEAAASRVGASRTITLLGIQDDNGIKTTGMAFYGIEDYEAVRKLLANGAANN